MIFSNIKNVERKFSIYFYFFYCFLLYNEINCSNKTRLPKISNLFNIYSVFSKDLKLKNKNEYIKTGSEGIKTYEQINKTTKVHFLPLILINHNDKIVEKTYNEKNKENEEKKQSEKINLDKENSENNNIKIKENVFEYLENNLSLIKNKIEIVSKYVNESDFILIPLNYNDILNKHLLDNSSFNNFLNSINFLFYLEQKKNDYNLIFFIYNYPDYQDNDKFIKKEKKEIINILRIFLKNHWKEKYNKYVKINFFFEKENVLDMQKVNTNINKKYYTKRKKRNEIIPFNKEDNTFFKKYKPDVLKKLSDENYFFYNLFSNFKLNILQKYVKVAKIIRISNLDSDIKKINIKAIINDIEILLNEFLNFQFDENVSNQKNIEKIKNKQFCYLLNIILTDLLEKYDNNLDKIKNNLYEMFKENIKKIKITSNIIHDFKREINYVDKFFELYNSKISFIGYFKMKDEIFEQKAYYIYYYHKMKFLQLLNETSNEIINYYISKGLYVRNYDFNSSIIFKNYSFFNFMIYYIYNIFKNKVNFNFNYLSPNAFGFSSYKDDISLSPKKDIMVTTSEIDQLEKINIPPSEYYKTLLLLNKNKR